MDSRIYFVSLQFGRRRADLGLRLERHALELCRQVHTQMEERQEVNVVFLVKLISYINVTYKMNLGLHFHDALNFVLQK